MEKLSNLLQISATQETCTEPSSMTSSEQMRVDTFNAMIGSDYSVECPKCKNKGQIAVLNDDGIFSIRQCECMTIRRNRKRIERSGLSDLIRRYTFDTYEEATGWNSKVKDLAKAYSEDPDGHWFFISGNPGTGKTHICTAICSTMIDTGRTLIYMPWREYAPRLKALINDRPAYEAQMKQLKNADVLYIDDFLKGTVTEADINLSFELLNSRYNDTGKLTIISSERDLMEIGNYDSAVSSRIYERSKGFVCVSPKENWRLK